PPPPGVTVSPQQRSLLLAETPLNHPLRAKAGEPALNTDQAAASDKDRLARAFKPVGVHEARRVVFRLPAHRLNQGCLMTVDRHADPRGQGLASFRCRTLG